MRKNISILLISFLFTVSSYSQEISEIEQSFENSWQAYEDNYAFFAMESVDWHQQYKIYRNQVTPNTTEDELISILSEMISPLRDGHSFILKGEEFKYVSPERSVFKEEIPRSLQDSLWNISFRTLSENQFMAVENAGPSEKNVPLFYYSKSDKLGYIRISRFYGLKEALFESDYQKTDSLNAIRIFDSLLNSMLDKQGLILDLRYNGGGNLWCFDLAERFIDETKIAQYKSIRQKGDYESFSEMEKYVIDPNDSIRFCKPVVVLTNYRTGSAAEIFLIALKELPYVTVIGTNTKGKFSNSMNYTIDENKELWGTLSNQRIYDSNKKCFEKTGVPADIEIINTLNDLQNNADKLIQKAIEILDNKD